jgi:gluconate 2-dehydrogenase gamma chain
VRRRALLASTAALALSACAGTRPEEASPWRFFTPEEGATVTAICDRLIPPDALGPGGGEAGGAVFIDRQLAGPYGSSRDLYMRPPFLPGTPQQGGQSPLTPAARYRAGLAALDAHCRAAFAGKSFADLSAARQDDLLADLEAGRLTLGGQGRAFFELVLRDTQDGFFADPRYGGNQGMAGWTLIGFPGARYDYRDWVERHGEAYPHPPITLLG